MHQWMRSINGARMGFYKTNFKYININKQREASISFKHLQINTWFWSLTLLTPNCQSAGTDLNEKTKKQRWLLEKRTAGNTSCTTENSKHAQWYNGTDSKVKAATCFGSRECDALGLDEVLNKYIHNFFKRKKEMKGRPMRGVYALCAVLLLPFLQSKHRLLILDTPLHQQSKHNQQFQYVGNHSQSSQLNYTNLIKK